MQINKITNQSIGVKPNFTARLFNEDNVEIKSFKFMGKLLGYPNEMQNRGSEKTDIFVRKLISEPQYYGTMLDGYKNSAYLEIKNPLFGSQIFVYNIDHKTNLPLEKGDLHHLDLLTGLKSNNSKKLEDTAVYFFIFEKIMKNIKNGNLNKNNEELFEILKERLAKGPEEMRGVNPVEILKERLAKIPEEMHGFSKQRTDDFMESAKKLLNIMKNLK